MTLGKNTIEASKLRGYIEEVEAIAAQTKELSDRKSEIMARAKSEGFSPAGIRYVVKVRKMKPHDRQEAESIRDVYLHAMGMDDEPPLFRSLAAVAADEMGREELIEHFKTICPIKGEFIVKIGGDPMRVWRDGKGDSHAAPHVEAPANLPSRMPASNGRAPASVRDVPNVDESGAEEYGRQMSRDNRPIIENPFPFGDPRRARCDEGWRSENGSDGMGPDD